MSEQKSAFQLGSDAGAALLEPGLALAAALDEGDAHRVKIRAPLEARVKECDRLRALTKQSLADEEERLRDARARYEELRGMADLSPARYSWKRGLIYLIAAVVVLGAEFAFLSQILAEVLQVSSFAKGEDGGVLGPAAILYSGDWSKIGSVIELFLATLGVLGLTVALKAARDLSPPKPPSPVAQSRWASLRSLPGIVFLLVSMTIVFTAAARLVLDFGVFGDVTVVRPAEELTARTVTMVIGLACPVAGLLLFTFGIDALSGTLKLSAMSRRCRHSEGTVDELRKQDSAREVALERASLDLAAADAEQDAVLRTRIGNEFRQGFVAGLGGVLHDAALPGGYRRIRPLLSAANATGSQDA